MDSMDENMMLEGLGVDKLDLHFPVTVEGFDGECFSYSIYFVDGRVDDERTDIVDREITKFLSEFSEDDYPGYVDIDKCDDKIEVFLDLGGDVTDCDRSIQGIMRAIGNIEGISKVVMNENE